MNFSAITVPCYRPTTKIPTPSPHISLYISSFSSLLAFPAHHKTHTMATNGAATNDPTVAALRKTITSEAEPLARRFRALFSLKHLACTTPATGQTLAAIDAIAAAFASPSALLKHELAYCLGQSRHQAAVPYLRHVLEDKAEDAMCRHEAAEALGALGYVESLELLKGLRDDPNEEDVIRETCDIAVDRIEWEHSDERKKEQLKQRYVRAELRKDWLH